VSAYPSAFSSKGFEVLGSLSIRKTAGIGCGFELNLPFARNSIVFGFARASLNADPVTAKIVRNHRLAITIKICNYFER